MITSIIFDLDGTLVNSIKDLASACNHALRILNYPEKNIEEYCQFVGNGVIELFKRCLPADCKTPENIERMKVEFRKYYGDHLLDETLPYNGIKELLNVFVQENEKKRANGASENELFKLAIATNKPDKFAHIIVNNFFPNVFDVIYGAREGFERKPSPEIINIILKDFNRDKDTAVMIGDSNVDIYTALNAGIRSIGCSWGFRGESELKDAGAEYIAHSSNEIYDFIKQMK
ncbi:putative phosphoglycolate phosphatase [Neocallimastix lanati (nom. inval.)]|jgi:phosphoglycolate phosphatase|uniref:Putative phosphoglycolate phosphatase n=1 Tax=Neocallimastix californiae TaxID=1754190 RepID=A0A1Y2C2B7_9FUNG|nr:putative phosphoglycolate phosphatase [Neocallimastix sp. JGI-2020a]ORY41169.1 putative phosphoglycolate phosphatase [Neocallimastix californiae]|eukprot:ORY41169.1 putative phosphoglycolate phosphatase [Neocallimastix californiae]